MNKKLPDLKLKDSMITSFNLKIIINISFNMSFIYMIKIILIEDNNLSIKGLYIFL
jgi:hypothetical protein